MRFNFYHHIFDTRSKNTIIRPSKLKAIVTKHIACTDSGKSKEAATTQKRGKGKDYFLTTTKMKVN